MSTASNVISALSLGISTTALWLTQRARVVERRLQAQELLDNADSIIAKLRFTKWGSGEEVDVVAALEAERLARQALQHLPESKQVLCVLAECIALVGRPGEAKEMLENVLEGDPDCHGAYCRLARVYLALDDIDGAERALSGAQRTRASCPRTPHTLAELRHRQHRYDDAVAAMKEAVRHEPQDHSVVADYGAALGNAGRYQEAAVQLRQAISLGARVSGVYTNLGNVLVGMGDYSEALRMYELAVNLNPNNVNALVRSGALMNNLSNDPASAATRFRHALDLEPGRTDALFNLAIVLSRLERVDEAKQVYRTYRQAAIDAGEPFDVLDGLE